MEVDGGESCKLFMIEDILLNCVGFTQFPLTRFHLMNEKGVQNILPGPILQSFPSLCIVRLVHLAYCRTLGKPLQIWFV
jgi:hypothetical protein